MEAQTYTVVLSNATHLVSAENAEHIVSAIDDGERYVDVEIDLYGDTTSIRKVRLITAHVIMLMENDASTNRDAEIAGIMSGKIARLTDFPR
jgi:hypothetical protein